MVGSLQQELSIYKREIELERTRSHKLENDLYFMTEKEKSKT